MAGEAWFRSADVSRVWIIADVYEQDLARVQVGQGAQVALDALHGIERAAPRNAGAGDAHCHRR